MADALIYDLALVSAALALAWAAVVIARRLGRIEARAERVARGLEALVAQRDRDADRLAQHRNDVSDALDAAAALRRADRLGVPAP